MTKRSVAIIGTRGYPSYYGGFETLVRHLAPYLAQNGWDVTVYSRTKTATNQRTDQVYVKKTSGFESKSLSTLSYGLTSSFNAANQNVDAALVLNVANGYWLPFLRMKSIATVVNVDGIEWERAKWGTLARKVFRIGARLTAWNATTLVCDSIAIQEYWWREFRKHSDFIPYGGDIVVDAEVPDGLASRGYVLMVARFVPENTVPEFFQAAENLSQDYDVVIVGSSGYGGELEAVADALSASNPRIEWYGHISDDNKLYALWRHAGAYFHGHSVGGTNPALVQAMACGAPVVARDTAFNREVLGDCAVFVDPEPSAIVTAIRALIEDRKKVEYFAEAGRRRAASEYSWEGVCISYEKSLLESIQKLKASRGTGTVKDYI